MDLKSIVVYKTSRYSKDVYIAIWNNETKKYTSWFQGQNCGRLDKDFFLKRLLWEEPWVILLNYNNEEEEE